MAKLTPNQTAELARLREDRAWSYGQLAQRFSVSRSTAMYHCLRLGAVSPRSRATTAGPASVTGRDGRTQRRFSPDEDARLQSLASQGLSIERICRLMGRPRTSVRIRLLSLGLREEGLAAQQPRQAAAP